MTAISAMNNAVTVDSKRHYNFSIYVLLILIGLYTFGAYSYMTLRFGLQTADTDTTAFAQYVNDMITEGSLFEGDRRYSNGFGFPAISTFIVETTGITVRELMSVLYPAISAMIVFVVFTGYQSLLSRAPVALLATLLLFLQSDFLFVTWRGSHERFTWSLVLMMFFLLVKSMQTQRLLSNLIVTTTFYICAFTLVTINGFFALSFMTVLTSIFAVGLLAIRIGGLFQIKAINVIADIGPRLAKLLYISGAMTILLYIFAFYLYPPLRDSLGSLATVFERVSVITLNSEPNQEIQNIATVADAWWLDSRVFLVLTSYSWIVLAGSAVVWLIGVWRFLRRGENQPKPPLYSILLWGAYGGFGLQFALSLIADLTGLMGGNLRVRSFTPMMLIAMPMVAFGLFEAARLLNRRHVLLWVSVVALVPIFSVFSVVKASNEPTLNNRYIFATQPERSAAQWITEHTTLQTIVWTGMDDRARAGFYLDAPDLKRSRIWFEGYSPDRGVGYFLVSEIERLRWLRLQDEMPLLIWEGNVIYDNGFATIYHRLPLTPYQR